MTAVNYDKPVRGSLHAAYSLCTEDCEGGNHVPDYKRCDRCGAMIHSRIFEVMTEAGEELTVGSECCKDVLGFKFGTWHERALLVAAEIAAGAIKRQQRDGYPVLVPVGRLRADDSQHIFATMGKGQYAMECLLPTSYGFSSSLHHAGVDLGLWSADIERRRVEVFDLTPVIRNELHKEA